MYHNNKNITKELLQIPRRNNASLTGRNSVFLVRNPCKDIIHTGANAEEYYHVELVCDEDNGTEYGIQAYGDEAKELYKEINRFTVPPYTTPFRHMCKEQPLRNDYGHQEQDQEEEKLKLVKEAINFIADSCFDSGCILMFKKLGNVCVCKRKI